MNTPGIPITDLWRVAAMLTAYPVTGIKAAIYLESASIGPTTPAYTSTGEVSGTGYTAGGVAVDSSVIPDIDGDTTFWTPGDDIDFGEVDLIAAGDHNCIMLYADALSDMNVYVGTYPAQSTAGALSFGVPDNDATNALVRIDWS